MAAGVTAAMAAWYVEHFQSSMKTGRRNFAILMRGCNYNNFTCALAIAATLTPLRLGQCMHSVKRRSIFLKSHGTCPTPCGCGIGLVWTGAFHIILSYAPCSGTVSGTVAFGAHRVNHDVA